MAEEEHFDDEKHMIENTENSRNEDGDEFYAKAKDYWKNVEPSVDGMLGGFSNLSEIDVRESKKFLKMLQKKKSMGNKQAVDCGSGIGRVSRFLLLPLFHSVDMVDLTEEFISASAQYLGPSLNSRIGEKFTCGLQEFFPKSGRYDLIWVQWVSGHLNDKDLVTFFHRCKSGLKKNGVICLKENIASTEEPDFDAEDHSYTRPRQLLLEIFEQADLQILNERKQVQWPVGMYEVRMFAMR